MDWCHLLPSLPQACFEPVAWMSTMHRHHREGTVLMVFQSRLGNWLKESSFFALRIPAHDLQLSMNLSFMFLGSTLLQNSFAHHIVN